MSTLATDTGPAPTPKGLLARVVGVILAPRGTYAAIVSYPKVIGALVLSLGLMTTGTMTLLSTEVGQQAVIDQQVQQMETFGRPLNADAYERLERFAPYLGYIGAGFQIVSVLIGVFVIAGLLLAVFNALLGGDATFKQVLAVVVHSGFVLVLAAAFVLPLDYVRESLTSPTSLAVFLPFLEENSLVARFFSAIDLFYIWWMVNLAIGLGVLYKRRTAPIAFGLLGVYVVIALVVAVVRSALTAGA